MRTSRSGDPYDLILVSHNFADNRVEELVENIEILSELKDVPIVLCGPRQSATVHAFLDTQKFADVIFRPLRFSQVCHVITNVTGRTMGGIAGSADHETEMVSGSQAFWPPAPEEAAAAGAVILVAEDNRMNQIVIGRQLSRLGYVAEFGNDGLKAWKMLIEEKEKYGLLLADCHMPIMDGFDLAQRIRASEKGSGKRLPIVALSADALGRSTTRALDAGMDGYLSKPVHLALLDEIIQKWLPEAAKLRKNSLPNLR